MFSLAFSELISVTYNGFFEVFLPMVGFTLASVNSIICPISWFFSWTTSYTSYYVTVLFSLDKFIAVLFPFKYRELGKPKVCVVATCCAFVFEAIITSPLLFVLRVNDDGICYGSDFSVFSEKFFKDIHPQIYSLLNAVLPVLLVFTFTGITIFKVRQAGKRCSKKQRVMKHSRRENEITRQMIVVSLLFGFLCLTTSICALILYQIDVENPLQLAISQIILAFLFLCIVIINSANFYMYVLFGRKFRADFFALLGGKPANFNTATAPPHQKANQTNSENKTHKENSDDKS